jgi:DNA-binding HxlR family transcriptional regulator
MAAMDLLGRRWALRVLWELRDGPVGARALLARCDGLSSSVLYDRLRDLSEAALVAHEEDGSYALTATGRSLGEALAPLDRWARAWARSSGEG